MNIGNEVHQEPPRLLMYRQNAKEMKTVRRPVEKLDHFLWQVGEQSGNFQDAGRCKLAVYTPIGD